MKIEYEYKQKDFSFKLKEKSNYSDSQISGFFKKSLKKQVGISLFEYLEYKGFTLEKCRICNIGCPPISLKFKIIDNKIIVTGFTYSKSIYCYGDNKECDGLRLNPNSFKFISMINLISLDEAKKLLKENNNSPFYKENWESEESYKNSQSRTLSYYINKYGEIEGNNRYKEHINKISISNSIEGYKNKYGSIDGEKKFKEVSKSKDSMSFKYFLDKNDKNYEKAIFEFEERKKNVNVSINNLINKYGEEIGIKKHKERVEKSNNTLMSNPMYKEICKRKACTKDNFIKKYGKIEGLKRYSDKLIKSSIPICRASKESLEIFEPLIEFITQHHNINDEDIYIGKGQKNEYFLRDGGEIFFYDFTIKSKKIIIEYNGILFHPKNENSEWTNPFNKENSQIAYQRQRRKIELAEKNGFKVLELWSDETDNIEKCIEFIKWI